MRDGARANVHVLISRDLVERLDRAICLRMAAESVPVEDMTPRLIATERREWLEALAERSLSALRDVELAAPAGGTARELREAVDWLETVAAAADGACRGPEGVARVRVDPESGDLRSGWGLGQPNPPPDSRQRPDPCRVAWRGAFYVEDTTATEVG